MTGYRTYAVAVATFVAGALARWGFHVDPDLLASTAVVVIPALMALMRSITHTSPGTQS